MSNPVGIDASRQAPGLALSQPPSKAAAAEALTPAQKAQQSQRPTPVKGPLVHVPEQASSRASLEEMRKSLQEAISRLNEQMKQNGRNLNFSIDQVVDRTVVTVKNSQTGEVVRQIPDETVLRVAHHIEALKGILLNESI